MIQITMQLQSLQSVVSGLNKGLAASEDDLQKADSAAKEIEAVGGPVDLSVDLDKLQGRWKLIYSSAFSSRTLGGSRPGPPTGRLLPITLGQVCGKYLLYHFILDFQNIQKQIINKLKHANYKSIAPKIYIITVLYQNISNAHNFSKHTV